MTSTLVQTIVAGTVSVLTTFGAAWIKDHFDQKRDRRRRGRRVRSTHHTATDPAADDTAGE